LVHPGRRAAGGAGGGAAGDVFLSRSESAGGQAGAELDPKNGDASLYVTRDLVPPELRTDLTQGRVLVTNWHVFEPKGMQTRGSVTHARICHRRCRFCELFREIFVGTLEFANLRL
jgi:hypothetical protein